MSYTFTERTSSALTSLLASKSLKKERKRKSLRLVNIFVKVEEKNVSSKRKKDVMKEPFISDEHDDHVRAGVLSCVF